ncbi:MAG: tyrosine-type recombinase/integrase [Gemmatimonadales bacterium]
MERVTFGDYASQHLVKKAASGKFNPRWVDLCYLHLKRATECFGAGKPLQEIGVPDVQRWVRQLETLESNRLDKSVEEDEHGERPRTRLTGSTIRMHLNALSNLFRRAQSEHVVAVGYNPVAALMDKPTAERGEARWLEVPDASLYLEAARLVPAPRSDLGPAFVYPLVATFLLTGGRRAEVMGLEVDDLSFDHRTVRFRKNLSRRRLKTRTSQRTVPMFPQLEEILRAYVFNPDRPPTRLLFPRFTTGGEAMVTDFRKMLQRVSILAGWEPGAITSKMFRHTYCSARLATLDYGAPISPDTVSREMGHSSRDLVEQVCGHLGTIRHRAEMVEYRVEQHRAVLGDCLEAMYRRAERPSGTVSDTAASIAT